MTPILNEWIVCGYGMGPLLEAWGAWQKSGLDHLGYRSPLASFMPGKSHDVWLSEEEFEAIDRALADMRGSDPILLAVIQLRYVEGKTYKRMAQMIKCPNEAVGVYLDTARSVFRANLRRVINK